MPIINIILPIVIVLTMAAVITWRIYKRKKNGGGSCGCGGGCSGCPSASQCHGTATSRKKKSIDSCCGGEARKG